MKKKNIQELHAKTAKELAKLALDAKHEVISLQLEMSQRSVKNTNQLYTKMKDRARLLTIAHAKRLNGEVKEVAEAKKVSA